MICELIVSTRPSSCSERDKKKNNDNNKARAVAFLIETDFEARLV